MKDVIDLRDANAFMAKVLPPNTPERDRQAQTIRFYGWLVRNSRWLGIQMLCPHCRLQVDECRCPQLGSRQDSLGHRNTWLPDMTSVAIIQWHLKGVTQINPSEIDTSSAIGRRLAAFIAYLKQQ